MKENAPELWAHTLPTPDAHSHKYKRGHVVVAGGAEMTGAACMSADAAMRSGAGIVTIIAKRLSLWERLGSACPPMHVYKTYRPYIMSRDDIAIEGFATSAQAKGRVCAVLGPGLGDKHYAGLRDTVMTLLKNKVPMVLDADGINAFAGHAEILLSHLHKDVVLTPHEGEFKRLFPSHTIDTEEDRLSALSEIAQNCSATILLKGHRTLISCAGQAPVINCNAPPYLASAGAGDVLAGIIAAMIAQGMSAHEAACCGAWIHGKSAEIKGAGLVASDIIENIPKTLKEILGISKKVG